MMSLRSWAGVNQYFDMADCSGRVAGISQCFSREYLVLTALNSEAITSGKGPGITVQYNCAPARRQRRPRFFCHTGGKKVSVLSLPCGRVVEDSTLFGSHEAGDAIKVEVGRD